MCSIASDTLPVPAGLLTTAAAATITLSGASIATSSGVPIRRDSYRHRSGQTTPTPSPYRRHFGAFVGEVLAEVVYGGEAPGYTTGLQHHRSTSLFRRPRLPGPHSCADLGQMG